MITLVEAQHTSSSLKRKNALDQRCRTKPVRIRCFLNFCIGHIESWGDLGALLSPFHSQGISRSWLLGLPNPQCLQSFLLAGRGLKLTSPLQPGIGVAPPRAVSNHRAVSSSGMELSFKCCEIYGLDFSAPASSPGEGTVKAESVISYFWKKKKPLLIDQEKKPQEINIRWCIERSHLARHKC